MKTVSTRKFFALALLLIAAMALTACGGNKPTASTQIVEAPVEEATEPSDPGETEGPAPASDGTTESATELAQSDDDDGLLPYGGSPNDPWDYHGLTPPANCTEIRPSEDKLSISSAYEAVYKFSLPTPANCISMKTSGGMLQFVSNGADWSEATTYLGEDSIFSEGGMANGPVVKIDGNTTYTWFPDGIRTFQDVTLSFNDNGAKGQDFGITSAPANFDYDFVGCLKSENGTRYVGAQDGYYVIPENVGLTATLSTTIYPEFYAQGQIVLDGMNLGHTTVTAGTVEVAGDGSSITLTIPEEVIEVGISVYGKEPTLAVGIFGPTCKSSHPSLP